MRPANLKAIAAMLAAVVSFSIMDALLKHLSGSYAPLQVTSLRALASLPFVLMLLAWNNGWSDLRVTRPGLHALRGALGVLMLVTFVFAVSRMSMANTYALFLCAPLLVAALSGPLLGNLVPPSRWLAIVVGLIGAVVVLQPSAKGVELLAGLAAAVSAICYALSAITINILGRTDSKISMLFWFLVGTGVGAGLLAAPHWESVLTAHLPVLAGVGLFGALGQYFITEAFSRASPFVVAPFEYTAILWAFVLDWAFWQVLPTATVITGAAIVIAGGLFIIWDEARTAMPTAKSTAGV